MEVKRSWRKLDRKLNPYGSLCLRGLNALATAKSKALDNIYSSVKTKYKIK